MRHWQATLAQMMGAGSGSDWWLSGGITPANCIAAYQPKGAASLAASYTNLANPGTYDAAPGVAPTWAAGTGWTFNGTTQYLTTGIVPPNTGQGWSLLVRYANNGSTYSPFIGSNAGSRYFILEGNRPDSKVLYGHGGLYFPAPALATGVLGFAGATAYRDGSAEASSIPAGPTTTLPAMYIGAGNYGASTFYAAVEIVAVSIYNTTITADQAAAVTTAMQAL